MQIFIIIISIIIVLYAAFWLLTFHPQKITKVQVHCGKKVPVLKKGQTIKVLSWNVQYMAGKSYIFYYEVPKGVKNTASRPSAKEILKTTKEVARIIDSEDPDIVLLQEIDEGAKRTDYEDQLEKLQKSLKKRYPCFTTAWYWKSPFVPHPKIMGAVGMKLCILSKYKINLATRYQLKIRPADFITKNFYLKRALLEAKLPVEGGGGFIASVTHLEAFGQGTDTLLKQVEFIDKYLKDLNSKDLQWVISGDFNLLPPGNMYKTLNPIRKRLYNKKTEIKPLFKSFKSIPSYDEANGRSNKKWLTHFPNYPISKGPTEIVDYIFYSDNLGVEDHFIRQKDTLKISDHLPVIGKFRLTK